MKKYYCHDSYEPGPDGGECVNWHDCGVCLTYIPCIYWSRSQQTCKKSKKFKKRKEERKHKHIIIAVQKIQEIFQKNYDICENYQLVLGTDRDGDQYVSLQHRDDYYDQWQERRKIYFDDFYGEKRPTMSILKDIFDFL